MSEIPHAHPEREATCEVMFRGRFVWWPVSPSLSSVATPRVARRAKRGGARRDRTDDLMLAKHALSQLSYGPKTLRRRPSSLFELRRARIALRLLRGCATCSQRRSVVGLGRLELPTSRLSSARSNQLSYKPLTLFLKKGLETCSRASAWRRMHRTSAAPGACSSAKKEKRRRRNPANGAQQCEDCWPLMFLKRSDRSA